MRAVVECDTQIKSFVSMQVYYGKRTVNEARNDYFCQLFLNIMPVIGLTCHFVAVLCLYFIDAVY